jgi:hypothetical protein
VGTPNFDEQQVIGRLAEQPELANAIELAQGFTHLVRQRQLPISQLNSQVN